MAVAMELVLRLRELVVLAVAPETPRVLRELRIRVP
jgi:hypothetical protein